MPKKYVEAYGKAIRNYLLNSATVVKEGTLNGERAKATGGKNIYGYHAYNEETGFDFSFKDYGNQFVTGFELNDRQKKNLERTNNLMENISLYITYCMLFFCFLSSNRLKNYNKK